MSTSFPCRLFVLMARNAARAVIFRRGPSRWVQQILWDTKTDTFTPGQWFHGRIYERRCDLSPDGSMLLYFALKGGSKLGTRTAISNVPYFTALALWGNGTTWGGGGLFADDRERQLDAPEPDPQLPPGVSILCQPDGPGLEDLRVYYPRLRREGWSLASPPTRRR